MTQYWARNGTEPKLDNICVYVLYASLPLTLPPAFSFAPVPHISIIIQNYIRNTRLRNMYPKSAECQLPEQAVFIAPCSMLSTLQSLYRQESHLPRDPESLAKNVSQPLCALMNQSYMVEAPDGRTLLDDVDADTIVGFCEFAYTGDYRSRMMELEPEIASSSASAIGREETHGNTPVVWETVVEERTAGEEEENLRDWQAGKGEKKGGGGGEEEENYINSPILD